MLSLLATTAALFLGLADRQESGAPKPPQNPPEPAKQEPPKQEPAKQEPAKQDPAKQEPAKPQSSSALEELLRRLATEGGQPSVIPPSAVVPQPETVPGAVGVEEEAEATAIRLTRASDAVQVIVGGKRRDLEFWDSRLDLHPLDEVRQGAKACTIVDWPDGAHYRFDGVATYRPLTDGKANPRLFEVGRIARLGEFHLGRSETDTVLLLPGGNKLAGRSAHLTLHDHDQRALEIRNSGPESVVIESPYLGRRLLTLGVGQRVFLPVLAEPAAFLESLTQDAASGDDRHGRLALMVPKELALVWTGDSVEIRGDGPIPGIARACGARVVLQPGDSLRFTRAPLGYPRTKEWNE